MLSAFLYRFIFTFLIASTACIHLYAAIQDITVEAQSPEEKNYYAIQKELLNAFGNVPKEEKEIAQFIGKTIASNLNIKRAKGFSATFKTFDSIKDQLPTSTSPQSTVIEKSAPIDIVPNNVQENFSSSPYDTVLSTNNPLYIDEKINTNNQKEKDTSDDTESNLSTSPESILLTNNDTFNSNSPVFLSNLNVSIYGNPFAHEKTESTVTAQPPTVFNIPEENNDIINPFAQLANAQTTESKSSDDSSEERKQNRSKRPFWASLFCIGKVN